MSVIDLQKKFMKNAFKLKHLPLSSCRRNGFYWNRPTIAELITNALHKVGRGGKLVMIHPNRVLALRNAAEAAKDLKVPLRHGNKMTVDGVRVVFTWRKMEIKGKSLGPVIIDEWHEPGIMEG